VVSEIGWLILPEYGVDPNPSIIFFD